MPTSAMCWFKLGLKSTVELLEEYLRVVLKSPQCVIKHSTAKEQQYITVTYESSEDVEHFIGRENFMPNEDGTAASLRINCGKDFLDAFPQMKEGAIIDRENNKVKIPVDVAADPGKSFYSGSGMGIVEGEKLGMPGGYVIIGDDQYGTPAQWQEIVRMGAHKAVEETVEEAERIAQTRSHGQASVVEKWTKEDDHSVHMHMHIKGRATASEVGRRDWEIEEPDLDDPDYQGVYVNK